MKTTTKPSVTCNDFVKRQTASSPFSHFTGNWTELEALTVEYFHVAKAGYREGVRLICLPPAEASRFLTAVVALTAETPLQAVYRPRREGEQPFVQVTAPANEKTVAAAVEIVVYSHETLGADASTSADWEIVSINARPTLEPEPMTPMAMARNFLALPGGTQATYSAEEFAKAILFWSQHAMAAADWKRKNS